jgi:hypothetical protein
LTTHPFRTGTFILVGAEWMCPKCLVDNKGFQECCGCKTWLNKNDDTCGVLYDDLVCKDCYRQETKNNYSDVMKELNHAKIFHPNSTMCYKCDIWYPTSTAATTTWTERDCFPFDGEACRKCLVDKFGLQECCGCKTLTRDEHMRSGIFKQLAPLGYARTATDDIVCEDCCRQDTKNKYSRVMKELIE